MLGIFFIIILICNFPPWVTPHPEDPTTQITPNPKHEGPREPIWPGWVRGLSEKHLVNMTEEIVRDVVYKLKHAEKIRTSHGVSISFQLGSVAAGIQEHFYHMLNMYRKYANTRDFKSERWPLFDVFKAYEIILVLTPASNSLETPNMAPLLKEMTTGLITMLTNETKDYRPVGVRDIMNQTRRQLLNNDDAILHFGDNTELRKRACYSISTAYQNALMDLRRYFDLRWLYVDNLEFEVGFVVHEIIHRYQMVLELYQMTERRFLPHENQNYAWSSYMLYIYVNILEQCKVIVHMCNMLHEIEAKYRKMKRKKAGVFDDYLDTKDYKGGRMNSTDLYAQDRLKLMIFEREQKKRQKMLAKERKKHRSAMLQLGKTTPRLKTRPTKHKFHDIIYGWSVETW